MRCPNGRNIPRIVISPSHLLKLWVIDEQVFVNKISTQNYVFVEPMYDAKGMNSLSAQNFNGQIHYTFYGKLTSSGAETRVDFLLKNFVWA
jgi:hypothetical protein